MLHKSKGIVISFIPYRETSIIVKIYTELFGIQTYIENGVRSVKGKNRIALFQPLTLLDMVVYHDSKKEIHRISEIKCNYPYQTLSVDIIKTTIGIFINEILSHSLKEHEANSALFSFLENTLQYLDHQSAYVENFHFVFLYKFCNFLGFGPENASEITAQLLEQGVPVKSEEREVFDRFDSFNFGDEIKISRQLRAKVLEHFLFYYKMHLEGFGEMKSLNVLREVLD
ncbi:MAG: DNA repair protein RecO [Spirosomataceae bacterium]|jgi:DNA repair protein RecO (recombination protein O)